MGRNLLELQTTGGLYIPLRSSGVFHWLSAPIHGNGTLKFCLCVISPAEVNIQNMAASSYTDCVLYKMRERALTEHIVNIMR
jgi:hypothetical protein